MNDKDFREQQARVRKFLKKWVEILGLRNTHRLKYEFYMERNGDNPRVMAEVNTTWQYQMAIINFYLPVVLEEEDDDYVENVILHELSHILVAPMMLVDDKDQLSLTHEFATESVARSIMWSYEAGQKASSNAGNTKKNK